MTVITRNNGWSLDLAAKTMVWPVVAPTPVALPDATVEALVYFGLGYVEGQSTTRAVGDAFRKDWVDAGEGRKAKDAPKECIPDPDSDAYKAKVLEVHKAQWAKLCEGYEVGARGSADPVEAEIDSLAREWLQAFASGVDAKGQPRGWYTLPKGKKVARDDDAYADPKGRYATFGAALAAFKAATTDSTAFALGRPGDKGKVVPWPVKTTKGVTIADLLHTEGQRRAEAKAAPKPVVTSAAPDDAPDADF